ncbi:TlpA family protein disulfide reductase [Mucilaginibacter terrenus]|uniref:TlpA family protein disulfide reductase n=1 Tax=Mucilaginibacter terrenus TaxID=2482727 RepID=A0A3E2NMF5_9SPHI|nr:TlpA disulfide reductase family protein [Mucilaginibacter terrenus]RFZ82179.1 TlpA family protein disulfide reductase [Mucilaginibacter terrenus]
MKKLLTLIIVVLVQLSCFAGVTIPGKPVQEPAFILKNYDNFFQYVSNHMKLSQDIVTYNAAMKPMSKGDFLKALTTGSYLPVRLVADGKQWQYNLYKMNAGQAKEMGQYIQGWSVVLYDHYRREGKQFPKYNFTDIQGNKYNAATLKGKTLVINCWFIGCVTCEKEMPALNELVAKYKNRKDIVFVALAPDSKAKLQAFLKRKPFNYAIVADQHTYISKKLNIDAYPTHFIINKQGRIVSVVDTPEEVIYALEKL